MMLGVERCCDESYNHHKKGRTLDDEYPSVFDV